jgi:hypothetical protein
MEEPERVFTADEANALLPQVEPVVARMREAAAGVREARPVLVTFAARASTVGGARPTDEENAARRAFAAAERALGEALVELQALGVWVKDVDRGLVDFPSRRSDELVELCWLHGEPAVSHWHRIGEGFAGRRPLDAD